MPTSQPKIHRKMYRKLHLNHISLSSIGSFIAIALIASLSVLTGYPFLIPPFGATCYIIFVIPHSAFAQPRHIIGGHLLAGVVGLFCLSTFGTTWWSQAFGISLIVAGMQLTRTAHPPAAATTILVLLQNQLDSGVLFTILIGSVLLSIIAVLFNKYILNHTYPHYWW